VTILPVVEACVLRYYPDFGQLWTSRGSEPAQLAAVTARAFEHHARSDQCGLRAREPSLERAPLDQQRRAGSGLRQYAGRTLSGSPLRDALRGLHRHNGEPSESDIGSSIGLLDLIELAQEANLIGNP
jgi:hypothetical protein